MAVEDNSDRKSAEDYRQMAEEMKHQAQRAETAYLQGLYASIADNWETLAAQMANADRALKQDRATENWENQDAEDHPVPPPGAKPDTKPHLPRA